MAREHLSFNKMCVVYAGNNEEGNKGYLMRFLKQQGFVEDIHTPTEKGLNNGIEFRTAKDGGRYPVYGEAIQEMVEKLFNERTDEDMEQFYKERRQDYLREIFGDNEAIELPPIDYLEGMTDEERRIKLDSELKKYYGADAEYRDGQYEAIEGVLRSKKTLVVQKTGWGKSLVYFMSTKMIREKNEKRFTLIISPLLALMNNQIDAASILGLNVKTINSTNENEWEKIYRQLFRSEVDALIVSPERLANEEFQGVLYEHIIPRIGLFVVDEAHCISDWGHDFRPDYRRIINLIKKLPQNVPVLATTATANNRVVEDIRQQIGEDMLISRGHLMRESIAIQTIHLDKREERMGWLVEHINELPGTGVIYCLTVKDCELINDWLNSNGIKSALFTGRTDDQIKKESIEAFSKNEIKVMVATTAFGMGYDKPDIGFVIHFQKPKDIISYYQQIGRAGRNLDNAYAICFYGGEDDIINKYFIDNAFPTEKDMETVVDTIKDEPGLTAYDVERMANISHSKIKGVLGYLEIEGALKVNNKQYFVGDTAWNANIEKSKRITEMRYKELELMNKFARTKDCYMEFLAKELDDSKACKCGKCSNCLGHSLVGTEVSEELLEKATRYVNKQLYTISIRKEWPNAQCGDGSSKTIPAKYRPKTGFVLSAFSDSSIGEAVKECIENNNFMPDDIIEKSADLLRNYVSEHEIKVLSYIPSWRHGDIVVDFAERLARKLDLNLFESLEKIDEGEPQETKENSYLQWENADAYYDVVDVRRKNTLLVDLTLRSGWTMTVCAYKLLKQKNGEIYPFALLSTANQAEKQHDVFR